MIKSKLFFYFPPILISCFISLFQTALADSPCSSSKNECQLKYDSNGWGNIDADWVKIKDLSPANHEEACYLPENVAQDPQDGSLILSLTKNSGACSLAFNTGKIVSKKTITDYAPSHGYAEIQLLQPQIKEYNFSTSDLPAVTRGIWPALWLLPYTNQVKWAHGGEIDLMELMVRDTSSIAPSSSFSTLHFGPELGDAWYNTSDGAPHWGYMQCGKEECGADDNYKIRYNTYDTYGLEWQKLDGDYWQIKMYLNGNLQWTRNFIRADNNPDFTNFARPGKDTDHDIEGREFFKDANHSIVIPASTFYANGAGDPVSIFNTTLNQLNAPGFQIVLNLAYGGDFLGGATADSKLNLAEMKIKSVKIWNIDNTPKNSHRG